MKTESKGSVVLLMLLLMGTLAVFFLTAMQEGTLLRMFVGRQLVVEQNSSLGHGLLSYGITQAKKNYDFLMEPHEAELEVSLEQATGRIALSGTQEGITISCELLRESAVAFKISCLLIKNSEKKFIIQGFQR